jgi:biotin carboxylase
MKYAVIVDAYSAGNLIAPEFNKRNIKCLHVQSTKEIWPILLPTFFPEHFEKNFRYSGNLDDLVLEFKDFDLLCVLPGTETGVELADALSERLGLTSNGTSLSEARRNKFKMVDKISKSGLMTGKQIKATSPKEILKWKREEQLEKIILKPINSAGSDNVFICRMDEEVTSACEKIIGKTNKLGLFNDDVLAQELLEGTEFFVNTISLNGKHYFTDIWEYEKRRINGHDCVYDNNRLHSFDDEVVQQLRAYVERVLDTLEVKSGAAHTEVMMTKEGPKIIEIGTRLDGLSVPSVNLEAISFGPLDLLVDSYADVEAFESKTKKPYKILKHARTVYLTSYQEGIVASVPGEKDIRQLKSFHQMRLRATSGKSTVPTINYFTAPGFVSLVHPDKNVVEKDFLKIRSLEKQGVLFEYE